MAAATKKETKEKTATKATTKTAKKTTKKTAKKATAPRKAVTKKATAKKAETAAKPAAKKAAAKKTTTKKTTATKAATKKTETKKKAPVKKAPVKKASAPKPESDTSKDQPEKKLKSETSTKAKGTESKVSTENKPESESPKIAVARRPVKRGPIRKKGLENITFKVNDQVVYPAHGVGKVIAKETQSIANMEVELYVIDFEHEKMKLRVPTNKAYDSGMRPLSSQEEVDQAIDLLQGRARIKRTMWSRRAQEYEAKINSGDLRSVAEVVRDLYRSPEQPEQSYSERQLYEQAVDRMAREVAAVRKVDQMAAVTEMEASLHKKKLAAA